MRDELDRVLEEIEAEQKSITTTLVDPAGGVPKRIKWLWRNWLAIGLLAIFDGDSGMGKSLVIIDLIARATRGDPMPDGHFDKTLDDTVFIISTEEDLYFETILPRLHAAGADFSRKHAAIRTFTGKLNPKTDEREMLTLPDDSEYLRDLIRVAKRETGKKCVVFYADPFVAHVSEDINVYNDHQVRRALAPIARIMRDDDGAALFVRQARKDNPSGKAIHSGGGSVGLVAAARTGGLITFDPDDEEPTLSSRRRILACYKNTNGPTPRSLMYRIAVKPVTMDEGGTDDYAYLEWLGNSDLNADDLASRTAVANDGEARATKDILKDLLSDGPCKAMYIYDTIENETNVKHSAIRYAANKLKVVKAKERTVQGHWWWALPQHTEELEKLTGSQAQAYASNEPPPPASRREP